MQYVLDKDEIVTNCYTQFPFFPKLKHFGSRGIQEAGWVTEWLSMISSPLASSAMEAAKETKFGTKVA